MNMHLNTRLIETVAEDLRAHMGEDFDADTFWDTLDGETNVLDVVDHILETMQQDEALVEAIATQMTTLKRRKDRISGRVVAKRHALAKLLETSGQRTVERPLATVSFRHGSLSTHIINADDIPSQLTTSKIIVTPDKAAIKAQIEAGEKVPGADLVRGPDTVTVRVA